jgi:HK97 family phage prohead protease
VAEWSTAYMNDLPDSAFLLIEPGGIKDAEGKTKPRERRHFPVYDASGKLDRDHLANALAQIDKANITQAQKDTARAKAEALAKKTTIGGPVGSYEPSSGRSRMPMPDEVMGPQTRSFVVELRAEGDGRTLIGRAVPYGETVPIPGGTERFYMGAFARQIGGGQLHTIKFHPSHGARIAGELPIGKTVALSEQTDGLHGAWEVFDTSRGNEALQLVRTGEVTGLSIAFKPLDGGTKKGADGAYERYGAHLDHVALTTEPVYAGAAVTGLRSAPPIGGYRRELERARGILQRVSG